MLESVEAALLDIKPDWVLVYGDTDSTLAGCLAAVKLNIPVAHVEAGLRSYNRQMPEEINRILTDHASELLFAPTSGAVENLRQEGISGKNVILVGDVMYDVALGSSEQAEKSSRILEHLDLSPGHYTLATIHRQENTDDRSRLESIFEGFYVSRDKIVLPLHPRTKSRLSEFKLSLPENVHCIDPVGYLDMIMLEKSAAIIATDSGGIQKEAFFFKVPCVTLRTETEWSELVDAGWNIVADPSSPERVASALSEARSLTGDTSLSPYGEGKAAVHIVRRIMARGIRG